ncbi:ubiquitin-conjugating enzyme/RWD-like protein [Entophlyctis helioformis]|nr:ubiquitin-conjugating enzyme/RWD-like protein [Entophlyctis helioformis]
MAQRTTRMMRELDMLRTPPPGVTAWAESESSLFRLSAVVQGLEGSPYEGGHFKLDIQIPARFPFEPPVVQFVTPIYHPNIDSNGRICLDILKMPPKGSWKPSLHLSGVLNSIRLLMLEPNPDDPLSDDIANEFKTDYPLYCRKARQSTRAHATLGSDAASAPASTPASALGASSASSSANSSSTAPPASNTTAITSPARVPLKDLAAQPADQPAAPPAAPAVQTKTQTAPPAKRSFKSLKAAAAAARRGQDTDDDDDDDGVGLKRPRQ